MFEDIYEGHEIGDYVVMVSGMIGKIISIKDDWSIVHCTDNSVREIASDSITVINRGGITFNYWCNVHDSRGQSYILRIGKLGDFDFYKETTERSVGTTKEVCQIFSAEYFGGKKGEVLKQHFPYKITATDVIYNNFIEYFEGYWFNGDTSVEMDEIDGFLQTINQFIDVHIVWEKQSLKGNFEGNSFEEENLREEYYQMTTERRNNFWRE